MNFSCLYDGSQIAPTLTRNNAGGSQRMPDKENFNAVIEMQNDTNYYTMQRSDTYIEGEVAKTLEHSDYKSVTDIVQTPRKYVLRRLTPLECARLQGFPDWWTDGVEGSDSNLYKMWGNGIALCCAADLLGRIAKTIESEETV